MDYTYRQPYRKSAAALAVMVHVLFLTLLYFGVSWRSEQPPAMSVDLWDSLPTRQAELPPAEPEPEPEQKPDVVQVETPQPVQTEIELKDQRKPKEKPQQKEPEEKKLVEKKMIEPVKPAPPKVSEVTRAELAAREQQQRIRAERAAAEAAQGAADARVIDEFKAKITGKIRRNVVMPPDVAETIKAEFDVTLLPGGSILSVRLVKPSGNAAYDSAVERAIFKSQPLPLPPDPSLFGKFRELHLGFKPVE
jgi:colicin import membrane protein